MKIISFLLSGLFYAQISFSQQPVVLKTTGKVVDNQKPVEAAAVSLLRAKDSSVIKIAATLKDGSFEVLTQQPGKFLLSVQAVGFNKYFSQPFELFEKQNIISLPIIQLKQGLKN